VNARGSDVEGRVPGPSRRSAGIPARLVGRPTQISAFGVVPRGAKKSSFPSRSRFGFPRDAVGIEIGIGVEIAIEIDVGYRTEIRKCCRNAGAGFVFMRDTKGPVISHAGAGVLPPRRGGCGATRGGCKNIEPAPGRPENNKGTGPRLRAIHSVRACIHSVCPVSAKGMMKLRFLRFSGNQRFITEARLHRIHSPPQRKRGETSFQLCFRREKSATNTSVSRTQFGHDIQTPA